MVMSAIPKRKLCWHCEGGVALEEDNCPYCGVYLHPEEPLPQRESATIQLPSHNDNDDDEEESFSSPVEEVAIPSVTFFKALALLLVGSTLAFFALALFLFNENGLFTLQWDASRWYLYATVAIPLLYLGWRSLGSLESSLDD